MVMALPPMLRAWLAPTISLALFRFLAITVLSASTFSSAIQMTARSLAVSSKKVNKEKRSVAAKDVKVAKVARIAKAARIAKVIKVAKAVKAARVAMALRASLRLVDANLTMTLKKNSS